MSKNKNDGLDQYGAGPFQQQQFGTAGVERGVDVLLSACSYFSWHFALKCPWWSSVFEMFTHFLIFLKLKGHLVEVTWLVVTEVRSESFRLVTERPHDMRLLCAVSHMFAYWTSPVSVHLIFSSSSVVSRAFSVLCARYARIRRSALSSSHWATLVPNFVSVAPSVAELARGEKSDNHSLN